MEEHLLTRGATATDSKDGTITSKITRTGTVNTGVQGTYYITYSVTNSSGNSATVVRVVKVGAPPSSGGNTNTTGNTTNTTPTEPINTTPPVDTTNTTT